MEPERLKLLEEGGFGHWLAGFIDGEGCFLINRRTTGQVACRPRFQMAVRADDMEVLTEIAFRTGLGLLSLRKSTGPARGESVYWVVATGADCTALVEIVEAFPLRAKKRRDFEIWKQAVQVWTTRRRGDSWDQLVDLKQQLEEGRQYENALDLLLAPQTDRTDPHVGRSAMLASGQRY